MKKLKQRIVSFDNILIIPHIDPDPDTLGSCLGLKYIFEKLGKTAYIVCSDNANERVCGYFNVAPEIDLTHVKSSGFTPDYVICVDAAALSQIGDYKKYYSDDITQNKIDLVIDHHYTNSFYGKETYLDEKASATGEIIFDLAKELDIDITQDFAKNIYCAIICDSGAFRYSSTTPKTMITAAELMSTGFDFAKLNRLIFQNKTTTEMAIERLAYNSLKFYGDGKIAGITITKEIKKAAGLENVEIEGINEIPRNIKGVEVGFVIKEASTAETGIFNISLRSNDYVNVAQIASCFGGGGHPRAAGCKYECDLNENVEVLEHKLLEQIEKVL